VPMAPAARAAGAILQYRKGRLLDPDRITPPTQVVVHGPKGQAALTKKDDVSVALLRARLKAIRDPDRRALLGLVLEGLPFAEEGARDSTLWQVLSTAAFAAPSATPDMLVDLVSASLAKMAEQHPKDHLTLEDAKDMATRALADAEAAAGRAFERGDEAEVAKMLLTELGNTTVFDEASIYTYDPKRGIWVAHGEPELSRRVQALAGTQVHAPKQPRHLRVDSKMVRGSIRLAADLAHRAGFFRAAPKGFPFQNGFVIVDSQGVRLLPHSPDHRARAALPYDYDPAAPSPKFDNFLLEVFQGDSDAEEKKALLQEFVGACLVGSATNMAKAVLLLGSGRNGKSTFIRIIKELFPEECQAAISPQDFEREYHRAELRGKLINVITELPKADLLRTEAFKAIIAGDPITARRIRHDPVRFEPRAGHLIAANTLPSVDDQSPAFFARLLLVSFNRKFVDKDDPESSKTEHSLAHKGLAEDIIRTELPGIMRWALAGAARLQARGPTAQYTVPQSHAALLESWRQSSDQVRQFLEEATTPTDIAAERTTGRDLYRAYREWANDSGHRPLAANKFGERVKALGTPHVKPHDQIQYLVKLKGLQVKQPWVSMDPVIPLNLIKLPTTGPTVSKNGPPDPPGPSSLKA
jgi:P4 family phage/plasmid primase-like protien